MDKCNLLFGQGLALSPASSHEARNSSSCPSLSFLQLPRPPPPPRLPSAPLLRGGGCFPRSPVSPFQPEAAHGNCSSMAQPPKPTDLFDGHHLTTLRLPVRPRAWKQSRGAPHHCNVATPWRLKMQTGCRGDQNIRMLLEQRSANDGRNDPGKCCVKLSGVEGCHGWGLPRRGSTYGREL